MFSLINQAVFFYIGWVYRFVPVIHHGLSALFN